jgi:protein subunit release factor A
MSNDELDPADLQIDVYTSEIGTGYAVRITHKPTRRVATATNRSQLRARECALLELRRMLRSEEGDDRRSEGLLEATQGG